MRPEILALLQKAVGLHQAGRLDEASALYDKVLKADRANADALNLKAVILDAAGQRDAALALFDRAIGARKDFPEAHFNRANTLAALNRPDDALAAYARAIAQRSTYADAHLNAALLLRKLDRREDALAAFRRMATACPNDPRAHYGLATEEAHRGAFGDAVTCSREALRLRPEWPEALNDLGTFLAANDEMSQAIAAFEQAARAAPDYTSARINRGLTNLARGALDTGWQDYAARFDDVENPYRSTRPAWPWPAWRGEPLRGKRILLWNDQGIGDAILYAGMIPEIAAAASECVVGCDPRLIPLFARSFPTARFAPYLPGDAASEIGSFDYQSPLLDAGRWRRRAFADFPNRARYLIPDAKRAATFRARHDEKPRAIGISWRSANPFYGGEKSLRLSDLAHIMRDSRLAVFNLQYDWRPEESTELPRGAGLHTIENLDAHQDLDGLASLIASLDLVITVSNTTAHLAAALGVPTWVLLPAGRARLWYWFREGSLSPWYPAARIFRRAQKQEWREVIARLSASLAELK